MPGSDKTPLEELPEGSSRSFRLLVQGPDDYVGHIAFSLYRMEKEEWIAAEKPGKDEVERHSRMLTPARISGLRKTAEGKLEELAVSFVTEAEPSIRAQVWQEGFASVVNNVNKHIDRRTDWRSAVAANLVAWAVTVGLTLLAALFLIFPSLIDALSTSISTDVTSRISDRAKPSGE